MVKYQVGSDWDSSDPQDVIVKKTDAVRNNAIHRIILFNNNALFITSPDKIYIFRIFFRLKSLIPSNHIFLLQLLQY